MSFIYRINTSAHRFWYKRFSRTQWKIVRFMNAEFVMKPSNYIDRRMWVEHCYEKKQIEYLLEQTQKQGCDIFIDIGANFGLYSCMFGATGAFQAIHSFECDPRNLYHLYGHLRMNDLTDTVTVYPLALGDKEKEVTLQLASDKSTGHSHIGINVDGYNSVTVQQKPLDGVLSLEGKKLALKVDVEGYEEFVIRGMKKTLKKNKCLIQMEIIDNIQEKIEELGSLGYKNINRIGNDWYFSNLDVNRFSESR